ncbi:uncharacterized protein METZ01_LOCUS242843, partial [marine metagenome]
TACLFYPLGIQVNTNASFLGHAFRVGG